MMKLGKLPAVHDDRFPRMSAVTGGRLPAPPPFANWYAEVGDWGMLLNDQIGCCVPAAILHSIYQMSAYSGTPQKPTEAEVRDFYKVTGYDGTPGTDLGSYVLGPDGLVPYWHTHGVMCGGVLNMVGASMRITQPNPIQWRQAIWLFGGILVGLNLPERIAETAPYLWVDGSGPYAGGHEVWISGYQPADGSYVDRTGPALYDIVSWGGMYRATETFLLACVDEVVTLVNPVEMNARGLNAADYNVADLDQQIRLFS
jgi:hypothetical protein